MNSAVVILESQKKKEEISGVKAFKRKIEEGYKHTLQFWNLRNSPSDPEKNHCHILLKTDIHKNNSLVSLWSLASPQWNYYPYSRLIQVQPNVSPSLPSFPLLPPLDS